MTVYTIRVVIPPKDDGYYFHGLSLEECVANAKENVTVYPALREATYATYDTNTNKITSNYERLYQ